MIALLLSLLSWPQMSKKNKVFLPVNHSVNFRDHQTGDNTNAQGGQCVQMKMKWIEGLGVNTPTSPHVKINFSGDRFINPVRTKTIASGTATSSAES